MKCTLPPFVRYTWPGREEANACLIHAQAIASVAQAIGLPIQFIHLKGIEIIDNTCSSKEDITDPCTTNQNDKQEN